MRLGMVANLYVHDRQELQRPETLGRLMEKAQSLGMQVLNAGLGDWQDPGRIEQIRRWIDATGVEIEPSFAYNYCSDEPGIHERKQEEFAELVRKACVPLGIRTVGTCAVDVHRWSPEPPLGEQLERSAAVLRGLARIAAPHGVRLALENHADYRGHEIATIVRTAGEPNLGVRLDTGNPFWTFEEPVDASAVLAPLTITTHIKDLFVGRFAKWKGVPLGQGHVGLPTIAGHLAAHAPDPATLPLVLEVEALGAEVDKSEAADASVAYVRDLFAPYLS